MSSSIAKSGAPQPVDPQHKMAEFASKQPPVPAAAKAAAVGHKALNTQADEVVKASLGRVAQNLKNVAPQQVGKIIAELEQLSGNAIAPQKVAKEKGYGSVQEEIVKAAKSLYEIAGLMRRNDIAGVERVDGLIQSLNKLQGEAAADKQAAILVMTYVKKVLTGISQVVELVQNSGIHVQHVNQLIHKIDIFTAAHAVEKDFEVVKNNVRNEMRRLKGNAKPLLEGSIQQLKRAGHQIAQLKIGFKNGVNSAAYAQLVEIETELQKLSQSIQKDLYGVSIKAVSKGLTDAELPKLFQKFSAVCTEVVLDDNLIRGTTFDTLPATVRSFSCRMTPFGLINHGPDDSAIVKLSQACPKLEQVYISGTAVEGESFRSLPVSVEVFDCGDCKHLVAEAVGKLSHLTRLRSLTLALPEEHDSNSLAYVEFLIRDLLHCVISKEDRELLMRVQGDILALVDDNGRLLEDSCIVLSSICESALANTPKTEEKEILLAGVRSAMQRLPHFRIPPKPEFNTLPDTIEELVLTGRNFKQEDIAELKHLKNLKRLVFEDIELPLDAFKAILPGVEVITGRRAEGDIYG